MSCWRKVMMTMAIILPSMISRPDTPAAASRRSSP